MKWCFRDFIVFVILEVLLEYVVQIRMIEEEIRNIWRIYNNKYQYFDNFTWPLS